MVCVFAILCQMSTWLFFRLLIWPLWGRKKGTERDREGGSDCWEIQSVSSWSWAASGRGSSTRFGWTVWNCCCFGQHGSISTISYAATYRQQQMSMRSLFISLTSIYWDPPYIQAWKTTGFCRARGLGLVCSYYFPLWLSPAGSKSRL